MKPPPASASQPAPPTVTERFADAIEHFEDEANYHGEERNTYWEGVGEGYRRAAEFLRNGVPGSVK